MICNKKYKSIDKQKINKKNKKFKLNVEQIPKIIGIYW